MPSTMWVRSRPCAVSPGRRSAAKTTSRLKSSWGESARNSRPSGSSSIDRRKVRKGRDARPFSLFVRKDADERTVHDETRGLEGVAGRAIWRDALGLRANQCLRRGEVRLSQPVGYRHRVLPLDQVDVPHRAVVELAPVVGYVLQDVERRLPVEDGGIQTLALNVVLARLAVDERDQALAGASGIDKGSFDVDVVRSAFDERHAAESGRIGHVLDGRGTKSGRVERGVMDAHVLIAAVCLLVAHGVVHRIDALDFVRPVRLVPGVGDDVIDKMAGGGSSM